MSGLSATGFERKRLVDIKADIETLLKATFGDNIDLSPQSGFGQAVGAFSEAISDQWESQENVYNSQYPSTAQGAQLSNVVNYNGIDRQGATNSVATLTLTGAVNTFIAAGNKASVNTTGSVFVTDSDVTIPVAGFIEVTATAEDTGEIEAAAGTITNIDTPLFGWTGVTNSTGATVGSNEETDAALRIRRTQSTQALGQNLTDSLFGQLVDIEGVIDAIVFSNGSDSTVNGVPPHQFLTSILGGDESEIATAIWNNTPQGIASFGAITVIRDDIQGFPQEVKYTRPSDVEIYFKIDITVNVTEFPAGGEDDIKTAIVDYGIDNFKISDDVIRSEFYTPINTIAGVTSIDLFIGLSASPSGTANLTIDLDEVSRYDTTRVEVNIV